MLMKKLKLLLAACALMVWGAGSANADDVFKDVTATYLTNADFEGEFEEITNPGKSTGNKIAKPNGWTLSFKGASSDGTDGVGMNSSYAKWNDFFSGETQLSTGGNNTYWVRMKWGSSSNLKLYQSVELPAGTYKLTSDYYKNGTGGDGNIYANTVTAKTDKNEAVWKVVSLSFTSDGTSTTEIGLNVTHNSANSDKKLAFDNFILEWNLTQSLKDLLTAANTLYTEAGESYTALKAVIDATDVTSTAADDLETQYDALSAAFTLAQHRKGWLDAWRTANTNYTSDTYANIKGSEKTALKTEIDKTEPTTADDYDSAKTELETANTAFTGAKANYDALAAEIVIAKGLGIDNTTADSYAATSTSTAETALVSTQSLKEYEYNYVTTKYNTDGSALFIPDWTVTGFDVNNSEHWSGQTQTYYNKWSGSSFSCSISKTVTLPEGHYAFYAAGRGQVDSPSAVTLKVAISGGATLTQSYAMKGKTGKGIDTSGAANFGEGTFANNGAGCGWEWRYIAFNLSSETEVALSIEGTGNNSWVSSCDTKLLTYDNIVVSRNLYNTNKAAAEAARDNSDYVNVTGDERTALENAIGASVTETYEGYNIAAENLATATSTFISAKDSYDAWATAKVTVYADDLPYASSTKFAVIATAQAATPTTAADAATAAAAVTSAYRQYVESNALAEGVSGAVDMTNLIGDPNFEGVTISGKSAGAWTFDQDGGDVGINSNESFTDGNGNSNYSYFNYYNEAHNNQNVHQVIENVAPGRYLLTATGRGHDNFNGNLKLYVVDKKSVDIPTIGGSDGDFNRGWNDVSLEFELETASDITIGVQTTNGQAQWWGVTRFRLVQLEATPLAGASDYLALNSAISTAEDYELGFNEGQYAPYNNVVALKALAVAKAVDQEAGLTKEYVNNVTSALTSAEWTVNNSEVDAIFDGQFAQTAANSTSGDITLPGWTKVDGIRHLVKDAETDPGLSYTDGGAAVFSWGGTTLTYGNLTGYTLPMAKHTIYELTLKVAGWRDGDLPTDFSVELDGDKRIVSPVVGRINSTGDNPFAEYRFYLQPTKDNSVLKIYGNKHFAIADLSLVKATTPIKLSVTTADYATYVTEAPLNFSETNIKAYTAKVSTGKVVLTKIDKVPANTPVVLYCEGGTENEAIPFATDTDEVPASDLVAGTGAAIETVEGEYTNYILNNVNNEIGFYKANGQKVAANRAYLHVSNSEIPTASRLTIVFEDATGITSLVNSDGVNSEKIYYLNGQRVTTPKRGIYIVDGKKVLKK